MKHEATIHGGLILVSEAACGTVRDDIPQSHQRKEQHRCQCVGQRFRLCLCGAVGQVDAADFHRSWGATVLWNMTRLFFTKPMGQSPPQARRLLAEAANPVDDMFGIAETAPAPRHVTVRADQHQRLFEKLSGFRIPDRNN